ncbi:MAG: hypothetical protein L6R39_006435 [Caloplaca ligustica]|nr:MAG: hypothetical protein L6R39_006435 [Caloplaca ligustica]
MLLYHPLITVFLLLTPAALSSTVSIPTPAPKSVRQRLSKKELHLPPNPAPEPPPRSALRDCPVSGSFVSVRFAPQARVISMPRMHDLLVRAIIFANQKKIDGDGPPDATFEFDGTGRNKWFYLDVDQTSNGILTWDNLGHAFEGLLICAFHRHVYNEIYFEIWETNITDAREFRQGIGYFALKPKVKIRQGVVKAANMG